MTSIRTELLEVPAIAQALGCTEETVEELMRLHQLPGKKYGRSWITTREALLQKITRDALANCDTPPPKQGNVVPMTPKAKPRRKEPPKLYGPDELPDLY